MKAINRQHDLDGIKPHSESVFLPGANQKVDVVTHDFMQVLYSLLSDEDAMQEANLLLDRKGYFAPDVDGYLDDINSGQCYIVAYKRIVLNKKKTVMLPIIFFYRQDAH